MNTRLSIFLTLGLIAVSMGPLQADAATIATYANGTDTEAAALINLAASTPGVTVSDLVDVGFRPTPNITRETGFGPGFPSANAWLFARVNEAGPAPTADDNYYGFTATADPASRLDLTDVTLDFFSTSNVDGNPVTGIAEVFVSVDGGDFASFGSVASTQDDSGGGPANTAGHGTVLEDASIDLSSVTGASSVEIRIAVGHPSFTGDSFTASSFIKDINLNATVVAIPEPGSLSLVALTGVGLLIRRRC